MKQKVTKFLTPETMINGDQVEAFRRCANKKEAITFNMEHLLEYEKNEIYKLSNEGESVS